MILNVQHTHRPKHMFATLLVGETVSYKPESKRYFKVLATSVWLLFWSTHTAKDCYSKHAYLYADASYERLHSRLHDLWLKDTTFSDLALIDSMAESAAVNGICIALEVLGQKGRGGGARGII